jgi:chromosomal replication initiation ATPase DnaA
MAIALYRHFHSRKSTNQIGRVFGLDHTTIMNALAQVDNLRRNDFYFAAAFEKLRDILAAE